VEHLSADWKVGQNSWGVEVRPNIASRLTASYNSSTFGLGPIDKT
jgi:hypothetical protein